MINPGKFKSKIQFLQRSSGQDEYGEPSDSWITFKTVWASKTPILGNEYYASLTTDTKVEVKFNCRFIDGVTDKMRIQHKNEVYEILSAIDVKSLHEELLCYCRRLQDG